MARSKLIIVSEDALAIQKARYFAETNGFVLETYTNQQWDQRQNQGSLPSLSYGANPNSGSQGSNVVSFQSYSQSSPNGNGRVQSINDLEAKAIEDAIFAFKGNLTEAAKALGIGRATLYRKVKQYDIDPAEARKKRAA